MELDYDKVPECLWDKNLRYQLLGFLFEKPRIVIDNLNKIVPFLWRNVFSSICVLAVYLCDENMLSIPPREVQNFVRNNWDLLFDRWSQIIGMNEVVDGLMEEAKQERDGIQLRNEE